MEIRWLWRAGWGTRWGQVTWLTCAPEEQGVSIPPQRFQVGCMDCGSAPGWVTFIWSRAPCEHGGPAPSHLLSLVASPAVQPRSRTSAWIWPRNKQLTKPKVKYCLPGKPRDCLHRVSPLLSLLSRHQLAVKESRSGHWEAQVYLVHRAGRLAREALFSCRWSQVTPGPRLLTMQMQ